MLSATAHDRLAAALDERILHLLQQEGGQSVDAVIERLGGGWAPYMLAIDRLSRTGHLRIVRTTGRYDLIPVGAP